MGWLNLKHVNLKTYHQLLVKGAVCFLNSAPLRYMLSQEDFRVSVMQSQFWATRVEILLGFWGLSNSK